MATSLIKIYNNTSGWNLYANKLFLIDDIESYLTNFTPTTISNAQYIKCELEISVNLQMNQSYSEELSTSPVYMSIKNSDSSKTYYYFVKARTWRSKDCVRFELVMDVLNTFKENTDYSFKANCNIIREHKDRFRLTRRTLHINFTGAAASGTPLEAGDSVYIVDLDTICTGIITFIDIDNGIIIEITSDETSESINEKMEEWKESGRSGDINNTLDPLSYIQCDVDTYEVDSLVCRNIDYVSEGINPLLQCGSAAGNKIQKPSPLNVDWYLLYRNQLDYDETGVNPVECYLIPSEELETDSAYITNGRLIPSFLEEGKYYWFAISSGVSATLSNGVSVSYSAGYYRRLMITKAGNKINVSLITGDGEGFLLAVSWQYDDITYIEFTGLPVSYNIYDNPPNITGNFPATPVNQYTFTDSETYNNLDPITNLDKTDAKNIKLIKLPYCPYDFEVSGDTLNIEDDIYWDYVALTQSGGGIIHLLKLKDMNLKLKSEIANTSNNPLTEIYLGSMRNNLNPSNNEVRRDMLDSKLYSSEFYQPTFYYDSFAFKVDLEKCDPASYYNYGTTYKFNIEFVMTSTINSKFMFTFKDYKTRISEQNYNKYLPIARNNEEVLYNVPYINYVRTGFNYDVKSKNISNVSNALGVGLSTLSIGASLLFPSAALKVAGVVSSVVALASSVKSAITSYIQNENSLKQKIEQLQNQASSVAGSDDVDLMSVYAENRLKYLVYKPNEIMRALINDLFYYCGYTSNRMGLPNHNTRINFDYLQADVSFSNEGAMSADIVNELVNCFKNGITYIHKVNSRTGLAKWDVAQALENWEKSLGV